MVNAGESELSRITIQYPFAGGGKVNQIRFASGETVDLSGPLTIQGHASNNVLQGTLFGDRFIPSDRDESFEGRGGDDTYLYNQATGSDRIFEQSGYDTLLVQAGTDTDDVRMSRVGSDLRVFTVDGSDNITSQVTLENQFYRPGDAVERLRFENRGSIDLLGGLEIEGAVGLTYLKGGAQDDVLRASARNETLSGLGGDDTYRIGARTGTNSIDEDGGTDRIVMDSGVRMSDLRLNAGASGTTLTVGVADRYDNLIGSTRILGQLGGTDDAVEALVLAGGGRIDLRGGLTVRGTNGESVIGGTGADDRLIGSSRNESFHGRDGDDVYVLSCGFGSDRIDEASGIDEVVLKGGIPGGRVSLGREYSYSSDLLITVENRRGDVTDELRISGHFLGPENQVEVLTIAGAGSWEVSELLDGFRTGRGNDTVFGGPGADIISGGAGNDRITDLYGDNVLLGQGGRDTLRGGGGRDDLLGGGGSDVLMGGGGRDSLSGGGGNDRLLGGGEPDRLSGDGGRDVLSGGGGRDVLDGGRGRDSLTGGGGRDTFLFDRKAGRDVIEDFADGRDRIAFTDRSGIDRMGELRIRDAGDDAIVTAGSIRIVIEDTDASDLGRGDFVFGWG